MLVCLRHIFQSLPDVPDTEKQQECDRFNEDVCLIGQRHFAPSPSICLRRVRGFSLQCGRKQIGGEGWGEGAFFAS